MDVCVCVVYHDSHCDMQLLAWAVRTGTLHFQLKVMRGQQIWLYFFNKIFVSLSVTQTYFCSALTLLVGRQEEHPACKN